MTRLLPPEEWPRLVGTGLETVYPTLSPELARVVVVERDGQIVACWALLQVLHAEGVWIHPSYRGKGSVAGRLWRGMREVVRSCGATSVITAACAPEIRALLLAHGGAVLPGDHFQLSMEDPCRRLSLEG